MNTDPPIRTVDKSSRVRPLNQSDIISFFHAVDAFCNIDDPRYLSFVRLPAY